MGLLTSRATKEKRAAVMSMIRVMKADGQISPRERKLLSTACQAAKISEKKMNKLIQSDTPNHFRPPRKPDAKLRHLIDVVFMMLADGQIDRREMIMCREIAIQMGIRHQVVPQLVEAIVSAIRVQMARDRIILLTKKYLDSK